MRLAGFSQRMIATDAGILVLCALSVLVLHTVTNGQYGFHRDELATVDDARFLSWGYVVYPPFTPFIARVALTLFGTSLIGLRFFAALAPAIAMVLTGFMAREMGGKRTAQVVAAWAAAIAGPAVSSGTLFQYVSFDYLWWVLAAYVMLRLLNSGDQRWWLALGGIVGLGMMTKYTMAFFLAGIAGGILLTNPRMLLNKWLWYGACIAMLIFLPNLVWQVQHDFISLAFLQFIHARDVGLGRTDNFLLLQCWVATNPITVPLWAAGLYFLFATPDGKRYRVIGWIYVIPLTLFLIAKGRPYYLAPAYPMLLAAGAVWGERRLETLPPTVASAIRRRVRRSLVIGGLVVAALVLPVAPAGSRWWTVANAVNGGNFDEEFGWREMAQAVARVRDSLPTESAPVGILAGDAGQAGAINLYGHSRGLPEAISGSNSHWLRGYGNSPPKTVITAGLLRADVEGIFERCKLAGHINVPFGIRNSAIGDHLQVFVCQGPREPWPSFWKRFHSFG
ncbi:MAG: glycosyltransferase family 39 protein [Acidobacteriia bacterium]|nr:glycosyltransferase family 39 protein [Terriglobia bacterium]MBV9268394.1 glycosyltransferase family 39 protein [Acidobacteriaceae bacterium]